MVSIENLQHNLWYFISKRVGDLRATVLWQAILEAAEMKKEGQTKRVIVTGCLAQRYSNDLAGEET